MAASIRSTLALLVCAAFIAGCAAKPRPSCYWNTDQKECWLRRTTSGSIKGLPAATYLISRAWARSHANEIACVAYTDKTQCLADAANLCAWDDSAAASNNACYGVDGTALRLLVLASFSPKTGYDVPRTLACPGTPAAEFLECAWGGAKNLGRSCTNPKCRFRTAIDAVEVEVNSDCMPKSLASKSDAEVNAFYRDHIRSGKFDPKIWGSCEGLCLAQRAIECNKINDNINASSPASRKTCEAKTYCSAGPNPSKTNCQLKLDTDAYGAALYKLSKVCGPRSEATCNHTSLIESDPATATQQRQLPLQAPSSAPYECKL